MSGKKRLGIMTGGGDCPGLNAAIRAFTKTALKEDYEIIGVHNGWQGFISQDYETLDYFRVSNIIDRGGTIIFTSRVSPLNVENGPQIVLDQVKELGLEGLVVIGGEGTLTVTYEMYKKGLPAVGIPKTIDNDVRGTDYAIGFQTAVEIATEALDRLRSTAESHHRVMLLEVMGRTAGWIATYAGTANGADEILIPEIPLNTKKIDEMCEMLLRRKDRGILFSIVVVAEGVKIEGQEYGEGSQEFYGGKTRLRLGGVSHVLGKIIEQKTGLETRVSSLDHIQRGGTPVAYDRSLATAFGVKAFNLIKQQEFGVMTGIRGANLVTTPLSEVAKGPKPVIRSAYNIASNFFG